MRNGKKRNFSEEDIRDILQLKDTHTAREVSDMFNVSASSIYKIWQRLTYAEVKKPTSLSQIEAQARESQEKLMRNWTVNPDGTMVPPLEEMSKGPRHEGCPGEGCEICEKLDLFVGREEA